MSLSSNKLELDSFIAGYSKFMRTTLEHTDKIATTIKDELDYVENFIKLQQLKFKGRFDYKIDIHQNVSTYIKVPKHCIFTYVENSLKYGLPKQGKGLISIGIKQERGQIIIEISDNGNGLQNPLDTDKKGTGKGIKIMTTIFELYQNRFKTEIEHSINNIIEENKTLGVFAKIKIKLNSSKNYK
jgi:LytS/YehU family sensor histidine kinase